MSEGQIGAYRAEARLGQGSFGAVYRVRHTPTGAVRALKLLSRTSSPDERRRFQREAQLQAQLDLHPNVLRVFEGGEWKGQDYLVLDYAPGGTLAERLRLGPLTLEQGLEVGIQLASALQHLHSREVVHRDLKPANVLFAEDGRALLADFGLARFGGRSSLTASGMVVGSPLYMAPEQAQGQVNELTPATDLYSLGCVLFLLFSGRPPFEAGSSVLALLDAVVKQPPPPLASVRSDLDPRLCELVDRCLEKDPAQRPPSAAAVEEVLRAILEGPEAPPPASRGKLLAIGGTVVALAALAVTCAVLFTRGGKEDARGPEVEVPDAPPPPDPAPLLEALGQGKEAPALRAWRELEPRVVELSDAQRQALAEAARDAALAVLGEDDAAEPGEPFELCATVLARLGVRGPALALSTATLEEAVRRAEAAEGEAERDALRWIVAACDTLANAGVPTVDAVCLDLLDVTWDPTGVRYKQDTELRIEVLLDLVTLGAFPGSEHLARAPLEEDRPSPLWRFLRAVRSASTPTVPGEEPPPPSRDASLRHELEAVLELHGDTLPSVAHNAVELWHAHSLAGEPRLEALEALAGEVDPELQPQLACAAALICALEVEERPSAALRERVGRVAQRFVAGVSPAWIERIYRTRVTHTRAEAVLGVLVARLTTGDAQGFRALYDELPYGGQIFVRESLPAWLEGALRDATR